MDFTEAFEFKALCDSLDLTVEEIGTEKKAKGGNDEQHHQRSNNHHCADNDERQPPNVRASHPAAEFYNHQNSNKPNRICSCNTNNSGFLVEQIPVHRHCQLNGAYEPLGCSCRGAAARNRPPSRPFDWNNKNDVIMSVDPVPAVADADEFLLQLLDRRRTLFRRVEQMMMEASTSPQSVSNNNNPIAGRSHEDHMGMAWGGVFVC